jgi:hypothetical protein
LNYAPDDRQTKAITETDFTCTLHPNRGLSRWRERSKQQE